MFEGFPVDEALCCLLKDGLLWLLWPLLMLLALLKPLPPLLLTKLMSASSSSLKAAVNGVDAVPVDERVEDEKEDALAVTWLT